VNDSVWLSLNQMAELYGRDKSVISCHMRRVLRAPSSLALLPVPPRQPAAGSA
jgi:hypothetical protein